MDSYTPFFYKNIITISRMKSAKSCSQGRSGVPHPLDLLQVVLLASGASFVWPRSGRPRATKSREVPRHMKSDEGLFLKVYPSPQDSSNELAFEIVNPFVVPVTSVKFKSASLHVEQWIFNENFSVFGQIENLKIDKTDFITSNSGKLSW